MIDHQALPINPVDSTVLTSQTMAVRNEVILPIPLVMVDKQVINQDEKLLGNQGTEGEDGVTRERLTVMARICRQTPGYRKYRVVKKQ